MLDLTTHDAGDAKKTQARRSLRARLAGVAQLLTPGGRAAAREARSRAEEERIARLVRGAVSEMGAVKTLLMRGIAMSRLLKKHGDEHDALEGRALEDAFPLDAPEEVLAAKVQTWGDDQFCGALALLHAEGKLPAPAEAVRIHQNWKEGSA